MANNDISLDDVKSLGFTDQSRLVGSLDPNAVDVVSNHMTNNAYGINHRQTPLPIPINKDHYGYTFFTRPQLNFQAANLRQSRLFHRLLTTEDKSWQRFIRCTLDPRLATGYVSASDNNVESNGNITCPFVDPNMAFIPILTNSLITISGWKDIVVPTHTSKAGMYREEHSMVDGITVDYSAYDLTASFRNSRGDPITNMFLYWAHYMSLVNEGTLVPYPDFIISNELDYCTRIYRLVMDSTKTKVQRIAACGASFPTAVPTAGQFDFSRDKPYNDVNAEINIPFKASGFICEDDILIRSFNATVGYFNKDMRSVDGDNDPIAAIYNKPDATKMTKIPRSLLTIFNNRGYPRIDPESYELEWYVKTADYTAKLIALSNFDDYLENVFQLSEKDNQTDNDKTAGITYI